MVSVCFYFQVHQPYRLRNYSVFDIGKNHDYFDKQKNDEVLRKVVKKCYLPATNLIKHLIDVHPGFKVSYSLSGVLLEQLESAAPETIDLFRDLVRTKRVEILSETYYHSLAFLYSKKEFKEQILMHKRKIKQLFNYTPKVFRNTELIYNNELAEFIAKMGYKGILAEGADHILGWRSPNFIYKPKTAKIALLLKNYKLSDDIAFRFSEKSWKEFPLTADKYSQWINEVNGNGSTVNLFMDYETFGEHQWSSTGIFDFLKRLPEDILKHPDNNFMTPSDLIKNYKPVAAIDMPYLVSWADEEQIGRAHV